MYVYLDPDEYETVNSVVIHNAQVSIKGKGGGRDVEITTQGDITLKGVKPKYRHPPRYYDTPDMILSEPLDWYLEGPLTYKDGIIYNLKVHPIKVKRSATADFGNDVDELVLRKKLGIPKDAKSSIRNNRSTIVFTWEEEVQ